MWQRHTGTELVRVVIAGVLCASVPMRTFEITTLNSWGLAGNSWGEPGSRIERWMTGRQMRVRRGFDA